MPLAAYSIDTSAKKLDLSEELAEVIRTDNTALLSRIGAGGLVATQLTHRWVEDRLNPNTSAVAGGTITTTTLTINVTAGHGVRFKAGTLFKFNVAGANEVVQVSSVSTDALTVVRGYSSTTPVAAIGGAAIMIISHNKLEGWKPTQEDWTQERYGNYNYLTGMGYGITITSRRQAVSAAGVPSEFAHQAAYRLKEFTRQLDSAIINSVRSANEGAVTTGTGASSMGGLLAFVRGDYAITGEPTANTNTTAEDLSPSVLNAMAKQIWDQGGMMAGGRLFCLVGGVQKRKIAAFDQAYRRTDFNTKTVGYTVEKFLSDLGFEIEVIVDPWMPDDTCVIGDLNRIKVGPLQGQAVALEDVAKTGKMIEAMIYGDYTMEVRNATEAFSIHTNLNS
jgi:hypothetical protein